MNNGNLIGMRLGITEQVGLVGNAGVGWSPCVERAGVCSAEGQDALPQLVLRDTESLTRCWASLGSVNSQKAKFVLTNSSCFSGHLPCIQQMEGPFCVLPT